MAVKSAVKNPTVPTAPRGALVKSLQAFHANVGTKGVLRCVCVCCGPTVKPWVHGQHVLYTVACPLLLGMTSCQIFTGLKPTMPYKDVNVSLYDSVLWKVSTVTLGVNMLLQLQFG